MIKILMFCCQDGRERNSAKEDPAHPARRIQGTIVVLCSPRIAIRVAKQAVAVIRSMVAGKYYTGPILAIVIIVYNSRLTHSTVFRNYGAGTK